MNTVAVSDPPAAASTLRRLYFLRCGFAFIWAALLFVTGSELGLVSSALLVIYPWYDVAANIVDARSSRVAGAVRVLYLNIAISVVAGVALIFAVASDIPAVLRVWGVWAIVAGLLQLAIGLARRRMGGQWPIIISGTISMLAGTNFLLSAEDDSVSLTNLATYATLGGIFFLVSALRLRRASAAHHHR